MACTSTVYWMREPTLAIHYALVVSIAAKMSATHGKLVELLIAILSTS